MDGERFERERCSFDVASHELLALGNCPSIPSPGPLIRRRLGPASLARDEALQAWPLVVVVDNVNEACKDTSAFLWTAFTRFEPAADIHARGVELFRHHVGYTPPIVIDARMKPWYPPVVECDEETSLLVTRRWAEYFPQR